MKEHKDTYMKIFPLDIISKNILGKNLLGIAYFLVLTKNLQIFYDIQK